MIRVKATGPGNLFDRRRSSIQSAYDATLRDVGANANLQNVVSRRFDRIGIGRATKNDHHRETI